MPKTSDLVKNIPVASMPKQLLATGLIVVSGLLIFLIIGLLAPKSSDIISAGQEFDTQVVFTGSNGANEIPTGIQIPGIPLPADKPNSNLAANLDLTRGFILSDQNKKISAKFQIPEAIKRETALWFDLYTKYSNDSWLIIREGLRPCVVEEWPSHKISLMIGGQNSDDKIHQFLANRILSFGHEQSSLLRIQRGMREDFLTQVLKFHRWMPTIEKIFKAQKLPWELSRFFLIPGNPSLGNSAKASPWSKLKPSIAERYLIQTKPVDESLSPLKVARALANIARKQRHKLVNWNLYFNGPEYLSAAFYAVLFAESYWDELQFEKYELDNSLRYKAFRLARKTSVGDLLKQLKSDLPNFLESNPDLVVKERGAILPKTFVFFVAK
jgi:hypothetical protein